MTEVDRELLGRLLLRVEADTHRGGWDQPAQLLALYDWYDTGTEQAYARIMASRRGGPLRVGRYAAQSVVPDSALDGNPVNALFRFAMNIRGNTEHPAVAYILMGLRQPGLLGLTFVSEGWMRTMASVEERKALGPVRFADMPGSIEMRNVVAVDLAGGEYAVLRERGKAPKASWDDELEALGGAVIESLRAILAAIRGEEIPDWENTPSAWDWEEERRRAAEFTHGD